MIVAGVSRSSAAWACAASASNSERRRIKRTFAAVRAAGFSADHVRLVTVHDRRYRFDHMVVAVYYNEEWLILDNLTNLLVRDTEKNDYEPTAVLDYKSARRYQSAFWMTD